MTRELLVLATFLGIAIAPAAHSQSTTIDKVKAESRITIGYRESSVPFSYLDENQKPVGYSLDLCMEIVSAIKAKYSLNNLDVAMVPVTSATRIPLLTNGTIDLECGSTTNTKERLQLVSFSPTTYVATINFLTKKGDGVDGYADLKGKQVVSTAGTTALKLAIDESNRNKYENAVITAKDHAEGFLMLETGRASAFVLDDILLAGLVANSKHPGDYVISKQVLSLEPYGIMYRKDDPGFKTIVDESISGLLESPRFKMLYAKWFQSPIPPRGTNLNWPMSDFLRRMTVRPIASSNPEDYK
jgi:glutamate/aspartate transport system substrate-binding protein